MGLISSRRYKSRVYWFLKQINRIKFSEHDMAKAQTLFHFFKSGRGRYFHFSSSLSFVHFILFFI